MERKKDQKIDSSINQQSETNDIVRKEEQNAAAKITGATSPANDISPSSNRQYTPILQWPYHAQTSTERPFSSSGPSLPTHSQSPFAIGQWHQQQNHQLNSANHQEPPPPHLSQSAAPFWLLQRPGYHFPGVNSPAVFQPFTPFGTTGITWQVPATVGGGVTLKEHHLVPNMCYPYPAFSGPWDPSSYFSEACHYVPSQPPAMSGCTTSFQLIERGVIRTPAKLSQKHQQLWEAQSAENVQLWNVIGQLKSEIADHKSQIVKLENEVSSLKQLVEESTAHVIGSNVSGQASKRGRPKRSVTLVDALPSSDDYKPRTRGRRSATKVQTENKSSVLGKVQYKEKTCNATSIAQQEGVTANNSSIVGVSGSDQIMPSCHSQALQQLPELQVSAKSDNSSNPFTVLPQQAKGIDCKGSMARFIEKRNSEHFAWPVAMNSEDSGRNVLSIASQGFYNSNGVITQGGKMVPGWSFVTEEDGSDEVEDAGAGSSAKDGNEEMADDGSSDAEEEIARAEAEGLPQFNEW